MTRLECWVWLAELRHLSVLKKNLLLCSFSGAEQIWACSDEQAFTAAGLSPADAKHLLDKDTSVARRIIDRCVQLNISILTLRDTAYPDKLRNIPDAPILLYVLGRMPDVDAHLSIAAIGSRHPSAYGQVMAAAFSDRLARAGTLIVTGMAIGLDHVAARAALQADRPCIAVLGSGVDVCYPRSSKDIYDWIPQRGAILSEYPPGSEPLASHFPERNRIMSALSDGVLILEAAEKSGTLITAACAAEQGRDVFCVPGNVDSDTSAGVNRLISQGEAKAVLRPWDILCEYTARYGDLDLAESTRPFRPGRDSAPVVRRSPEPQPAPATAPTAVGLSAEEQAIFAALGEQKVHIDDILRATGMPAARVLTHLTLMEMKGRVRSLPGKYYEIKY